MGSLLSVFESLGTSRFALLVISFSFAAATPARAVELGPPQTLAFDGLVGPGNREVTSVQVGSWRFAAGQFHTVSLPGGGVLEQPDNGTAYIASVGGGLDLPITLQRVDGSPFSLVAFDAAEGFLDDLLAAQEGFISAQKIELAAELASGLTVTLEFDLDGLRDGLNGIDDFEVLNMPVELGNVTSVTFTGVAGDNRAAAFALDNIVVAAVVPEPSSIALVGVASACLFAWRWTRSLRRVWRAR